ncbi:hypothetical protein LTS10_006533 [Elasticomyces elasticus]|nr:hypothetical protein LTS10_006533 [Elasticomyces elasticus]
MSAPTTPDSKLKPPAVSSRPPPQQQQQQQQQQWGGGGSPFERFQHYVRMLEVDPLRQWTGLEESELELLNLAHRWLESEESRVQQPAADPIRGASVDEATGDDFGSGGSGNAGRGGVANGGKGGIGNSGRGGLPTQQTQQAAFNPIASGIRSLTSLKARSAGQESLEQAMEDVAAAEELLGQAMKNLALVGRNLEAEGLGSKEMEARNLEEKDRKEEKDEDDPTAIWNKLKAVPDEFKAMYPTTKAFYDAKKQEYQRAWRMQKVREKDAAEAKAKVAKTA